MRFNLQLFFALFCLLNYPSYVARGDNSLKKCTGIGKDSKRLECFDALAKTSLKKSRISSVEGKWNIETSKSAMDDSQEVILTLTTNTVSRGTFGKKVQPSVYIRCRENKTDLYIAYNDMIGNSFGESVLVKYRIDKLAPKEEAWSKSTSGQAAFSPNPINFIKDLIKHSTLLVRVPRISGPYFEHSFQIKGLEEAIRPVRKACNW